MEWFVIIGLISVIGSLMYSVYIISSKNTPHRDTH